MAIYALLLFLCCRYGPNSDHTPLGIDRLPFSEFINVAGFLLLIIASEVSCTLLIINTQFRDGGSFDLKPFLCDFVDKNKVLFALSFLVLQFPCLVFLFDHSGMGFEVGA